MFTLQIFNANNGRNDIVKHSLVGLIRARFIRFQPTEFSTRKALRVEVYGILTTAGILCKDSRLLPFPVVYAQYIFSPLPTIHMNHCMRYGGVKMVAVHRCGLWYIHMH